MKLCNPPYSVPVPHSPSGLAKQYGWNGFDGVDWDMEGANEVKCDDSIFQLDLSCVSSIHVTCSEMQFLFLMMMI